MNPHIIALDQGTTSSRAIVFNAMGAPVSVAQYPFEQLYPRSGWVEHDPEEIWQNLLFLVKELLDKKGHYYRLYTRQYEDEATSSLLN